MGRYERCADLEAAANTRANAILEDVRKRNADYDERTEHGRLEGVWLVPSG